MCYFSKTYEIILLKYDLVYGIVWLAFLVYEINQGALKKRERHLLKTKDGQDQLTIEAKRIVCNNCLHLLEVWSNLIERAAKKQKVKIRGGFREGAGEADAFLRGFDPCRPKDPPLYYFEISIFDGGP